MALCPLRKYQTCRGGDTPLPCQKLTFSSPFAHCRKLAVARANDLIKDPPGDLVIEPPGNFASHVGGARGHATGSPSSGKYSVPIEGTAKHCIAMMRSKNSNIPDDLITAVCTDWQENVEVSYMAREVFKDDAMMNATFGGRDVLASMLFGAISAARMNITEFVTQGESARQKWESDMRSAINWFTAGRSVSSGLVLLGTALCFTPLCDPAILTSMLYDMVSTIPTAITTVKIDDLIKQGIGHYMTEQGKQAKGMIDFLQTISTMNETGERLWIYLSTTLMGYVKLAVTSNVTYTVDKVRRDLNKMQISRWDMDENVKLMADVAFGNSAIHGVTITSWLQYMIRWVPINLSLTGFSAKNWKKTYQYWKTDKEKFRLKQREFSNLMDSFGHLDTWENNLKTMKEGLLQQEQLISKLINDEFITEHEFMMCNLRGRYRRDIVEYRYERPSSVNNRGEVTGYKLRENVRDEIIKYKTGTINIDEEIIDVVHGKTIPELEKRIRLVEEVARGPPKLYDYLKEARSWERSISFAVFSLISGVLDVVLTRKTVENLNDFVSSAIDNDIYATSVMENTLKAWQAL